MNKNVAQNLREFTRIPIHVMVEVKAGDPVTISWVPVTESHAVIGTSGSIKVINYEVVTEIEGTTFINHLFLPPSTTSAQVPPEIATQGEEIKLEVLVREKSGNQSATETCFEVVVKD